MTTNLDLREALRSEAGAPAQPSGGWDDVVQRGRHRQRVRRVQAVAGIALVAGVAATVLALAGDDPTVDTVPPATDPPKTTIADDPAGPSRPELPWAFRTPAFRAQGPFLTMAMLWEQPSAFDPCTDLRPRVEETSEQISVELVGNAEDGTLPWADCGTGFTGSWGTIELDDPVGARTVNGRVVIDGTSLLFPEELPPPFELERREESGSRNSEPDEHGYLQELWSWSFSWRGGRNELRLVNDAPSTSDGCDGESEDIEVRGTTARLCRGPVVEDDGVIYELTWDEDGRPISIVYQSIDPAPLTLDGFLTIVEGLRPLGS